MRVLVVEASLDAGDVAVIIAARAHVDLTLRAWLDRLLVDEVIRRSGLQAWETMTWDGAWYEEWITTFLRDPGDF